MATLRISLPNDLHEFVDEQAARASYRTSSEYVRRLIAREQERQKLRGTLLDGAQAAPSGAADAAYFAKLRKRITSGKLPKRAT
jgi:antitoxin ParD1/3/4